MFALAPVSQSSKTYRGGVLKMANTLAEKAILGSLKHCLGFLGGLRAEWLRCDRRLVANYDRRFPPEICFWGGFDGRALLMTYSVG